MVFIPKYTVTARMLQNLAKIEIAKQNFETQPLSPQLLHSLRETAKISAVHYSTRIEGNKLTLNEVAEAIRGKKLPQKERDEKEVKAYYQAWNAMEQAVREHQVFGEDLIGRLHTLIEGEKKIIPYRNCQNAIYDSESGAKVYLPPEFGDVPQMMLDLCEWANQAKELPVPLIAGIVHYQFVTIHPYIDGNGRTARLLTSFIMRANGYDLKGIYSMEEYYAQNLNAYYNALQTHPHHNYYYGRQDADITSWLEYFIGGVAESFDKIDRQATFQKEQGFSVDRSPIIRELDIKQRKIVELFMEFKEVNSGQIAQKLSISPESARGLLRRWLAEGFLQYANPAKKSRTYKLADKYERLIGSFS